MVDLFKEMGEPSKRTILALLRSGPKSVGELVDATGMKQPNVSNHLARLKARGLVKASKVGRQVFYTLASAEIAELLAGILTEEEMQSGTTLELSSELTKTFARFAVQGDEMECTRMVDALVRQGEPIIVVYERLFADAMVLIGRWWEVDAIDVGQEHLASAIIERLMARVLHHAPPPRPNSLRAVLGCSEGNYHSLGLRMVADIMRLSGWRTFYLGANVPTNSFVASVREHQAYAALLSCPTETYEPTTMALIHELTRLKVENPQLTIGVGGRWANENRKKFLESGADFVGGDLQDFTIRVLPWLESEHGRRSGKLNGHH